MNTINESEILEIIDCTPAWEALLLPMLDLYAQYRQKITVILINKKMILFINLKVWQKLLTNGMHIAKNN